MGIEQWSTTAGSNVNANTGINWDEGMAPSAVNDSARSTMADIRSWYEDAEWVKLGENGSATAYSISYVSATVFKFASTDRRTIAPTGRRVKAGIGSGTIYGTITDSSLSASDTQITVAWDSGSLDSSLSFVSVGVLSSTNNSFPRDINASFSSVGIRGAMSFASGATIASNPDCSLSDVALTGILSFASGATIAGDPDCSFSDVQLKGILSFTSGATIAGDPDCSFSDVQVKGILSFTSAATIAGNPDCSFSDVVMAGTLSVTGTITTSGELGVGITPNFTAGGSRRLIQVSNAGNGGTVALGNSATEASNARIAGPTDLTLAAGTSGVIPFYSGGTLLATLSGTAGASRIIDGIRIGADSTNNLLDDASNGAGTATLYIGNASITVSSDERVKTGIREWKGDASSLLRSLPVKEFRYTSNAPMGGYTGTYVGFTAQDMHRIAPWSVNTQGDTGLPWQARYEFLSGLIVKGWQDVDSRLAALEAKLQ